jgi:uncharacterized protein DUF998
VPRRKAIRRTSSLAGLVAGPFFLTSVGLNTWVSLNYLHTLGWQFVGGAQVPWPSSLARGPYAWAQIATFVITGLLVGVLAASVREGLPDRRASKLAVALMGLLSAALILAAFPVDVPMLTGGQPETWNGWIHGIAFLLIIATGVLAPLAIALAVRHEAGWRPLTLVSVAAAVLFVIFLLLPWGNATFLMAIVTLFVWIAAVAARLRAPLAEP